ncbi:hypothetical protein SDC9_178791 [bioreactor metagenome]|uniref:Uncharacterized protein n=1 Tax=bioreactor metagenome TaxID=1076179 RepID=A0A645GX76_9ZZZZ
MTPPILNKEESGIDESGKNSSSRHHIGRRLDGIVRSGSGVAGCQRQLSKDPPERPECGRDLSG